MNRKQAYEQKLDAQLDEWKADIDKLSARASQAEGEAQIQLNETVEKLQAQQQIAQHKLEKFRDAGDEALDDLKSGLDIAWKNLGKAIDSATSRFQ